MNPLDEKASTLSRCGSFYYRTLVDESKADAEFVSHLSSYTRLTSLGEKISTAVQGGCYYKDLYKLIKFTDADVDWNGVKQALQHRISGGAGVITEKLEQISISNAKELGTQAWELSADDVPAGIKQVTKVKMQVINTAPVTDPLYLQVFHATPDAATPVLLAASENAVELEAGNYATWDFALLLLGTEFLNNGGNLMFQFATVADAAWQSNAAIPYSRTVGVGAYVPSVQFWRNVAPEQSLPTYNRSACLTIKDHLFITDDKWNWVSREGTPQPIAFPGANGDIVLSDSQELIWDLHIDPDIMVTSIQMEDGTILYANQDFASQFGKLTFLQNPIAIFPTMQFMARSYIGRMPNLYNYLVHADSVYGSISRMLRYVRGSQSIKSLYYASAQAAGLAVVDQDCTVVAVSPLLDGKAYITTAGRYDAAYPHTPLKPGAKLAKNYIIGGNQLYRLIGPYDPVPSNIAGINLGTALPVPGLFAPNKEIAITDEVGNYRPDYTGDVSALTAYYTYIEAQQKQPQEPNKRENGMQHFRYTACPNRCVIACLNESYMPAQMKLRLMTYLQRELPIGSVLVTASLPNIVNEFQSSIDGAEFVLEELRAGLDQLVGDGNYEVAIDSAGDKLVVHTDRISDAEAQAVTDLIERVVPYNIVVERYNHNMEISWRDINKYAACKTRDDVVAVNPDYINDLTSDGEWVYPLPEMTTFASNPNGDWWAGFFYKSPIKKIKAVFPKCTYCHAFFGGANNIADADVEFPIATRVSAPARSLYKLKNFRIIAPLATTSDSACYWNQCKNQDWYIYYPKTTNMESMFQDCRDIEEIKGEFGAVATTIRNAFYRCYKLIALNVEGEFGAKATTLTNAYFECSQLRVFPTNYPKASTAAGMFNKCQIPGEAAIAVLNSLPTYVNAAPDAHPITMGIHKDYENDPDVLAALDNATAKGWTIERQWNGTPTSTASTFGFNRIWARKVEDEQGEYVDSDGSRWHIAWCHTLSTPDGSTPEDHGYELYRSIEAAAAYWDLQLWIEPVEPEEVE